MQPRPLTRAAAKPSGSTRNHTPRINPLLRTVAVVSFLLLAGNAVSAAQPARGISVIVLDAGHGGNDPGAHYAGVYEKDITLKVVLRLGKRIEQEMPGVKVVYTRTTDKQLGETKNEDLQARADIANRAGGDLFLSVHVNASHFAAARGTETLVMGESTKEQRYNGDALYENHRDDLIDMSDERTAAIVRAYIQNLQFTYGEYSLALANCIQQNYKASGRSSRGVKPQLLRVLYATDMPGVLTEIGFLSNAKDAAYMKSEKGINEIVQALLRSVKEYSARLSQLRGDVSADAPQTPRPKVERTPLPDTKPAAPAAAQPSATDKPAPRPAQQQPAAQPQRPAPASTPQPSASDDAQPVRFAVQIKAAEKTLPAGSEELRNYRNEARQLLGEGRYRYKYCVGSYATYAEAHLRLGEVRKEFPDAFIVRYRGSRIVK
ncbi:MAG: N-acetylmuramoyl-L-alanine amidase [Alistipes sp.]|nr:N-acetylmuramoyl-L-alanine amidase [Alistipes sp.]